MILNLASIMAMQPSVLILDEPTSQLDPIAAADFLATLGKINRELGTTVVLTEHRLEDAFLLASRVAVMDRGRLLCTGSPAEVGAILRGAGHSMFLAMPTPMRIWASAPDATSRIAKLQELATLNGGIAIEFTDTVYALPDGEVLSFDELRTEAIQSDPQLQTLRSDQTTALRQVSVNKAKGLPGFELGYRMNPASGGERFNGFLVGITIPLFSNRNNVKQAKAQARYTEMQLESASFTVENGLRQLYDQSVSLKKSIDEYKDVLKRQNSLVLLNKAIQAGQISMIEYFVDVTTYYQSVQNYLQLQNQYQKVMAQLYKYRL